MFHTVTYYLISFANVESPHSFTDHRIRNQYRSVLTTRVFVKEQHKRKNVKLIFQTQKH